MTRFVGFLFLCFTLPGLAQLTPTLTSQPSDIEVVSGSVARFEVTADGPLLAYQWFQNEVAIPGATTNFFEITQAKTDHEGQFWVRVENAFGMATSRKASLKVHVPIVINAFPTAKEVVEGESLTLTVDITGNYEKYQWYFNGTNISNATSEFLQLNEVTPEQEGDYSVKIQNLAGTVTSEKCVLRVLRKPKVVQGLADYQALIGEKVVFEIVAEGTAPLSYTWFHNNAPIPGNSSPRLEMWAAKDRMGTYRVEVANPFGTARSGDAKLSIGAYEENFVPYSTIVHPDTPLLAGQKVVLSTVGRGDGSFTYSWIFNGTPLAGEHGSSLIIENFNETHEGEYAVVTQGPSSSKQSPPIYLQMDPIPALGTWTWKNPQTRLLDFDELLFHEGVLWGVGKTQLGFTRDGINWEIQESPAYGKSPSSMAMNGDRLLISYAYGMGYSFVAVSSDRKQWSFTAVECRKVFGTNGFFYGENPREVLSSEDGKVWSIQHWQSMGLPYIYGQPFLHDLCFGNGLFVLGTDYSFFTSSDFKNWKPSRNGQSMWVSGIYYFDHLFLAIGSEYYPQISLDGTNWNGAGSTKSASMPSYPLSTDAAYGNGKCLILGAQSLASDNFGPQRFIFPPPGKSIEFAFNKFFIAGSPTYHSFREKGLFSSSDGNFWEPVQGAVHGWTSLVRAEDGTMATIGPRYSGRGTLDSVWEIFPAPIKDYRKTKMVVGNGKYVAASDFHLVAVSEDLKTWMELPSTNRHLSLTFGQGKFVLLQKSKQIEILTSSDGLNWTTSPTLPASFGGVVFGNDTFLAFAGTNVFLSGDASTWEQVATLPSNAHSIFFQDGWFTILTSQGWGVSRDGLEWTYIGNAPQSKVHKVFRYAGRWVGVGDGVFSTEGRGTWVEHRGPGAFIQDAMVVENRMVVVGNGGMVVVSEPFSNWSITRVRRSGADLELEIEGQKGVPYVLESSSDLSHWEPLLEGELDQTVGTMRVPLLGTHRFFRVSEK